MIPGHQRQRLTMVSHRPTDVFPDTRASSHTVVVPETATAIGSCGRCGLPPSCSSLCMAIAIHVEYACDTTNSTSTIPPSWVSGPWPPLVVASARAQAPCRERAVRTLPGHGTTRGRYPVLTRLSPLCLVLQEATVCTACTSGLLMAHA